MNANIFPRFIRFYRLVTGSIAFVPVIIALLFTIIGLLLRYFEQQGLSAWFVNSELPFLVVDSVDTARTLLSTIIGGLISLTVFSFSMIMIVLNQAASSLSPRLLPGLIRERKQQIVLGIYLGVIIFSLITLSFISTKDGYFNLPSFTIFLCALFTVGCLGVFIFFINSISTRVQIGSIMAKVHHNALADIDKTEKAPDNYREIDLPEDVKSWYALPAARSGYLDELHYQQLADLSREFNTRVYVCTARGFYVLKGLPLVRVERKLSREEAVDFIGRIHLLSDETDDWYLPRLKQLVEIALRAMSPGINDPGTALEIIDLVTEILARIMRIPLHNSYQGKEGAIVFYNRTTFEEILRTIMQELRQYCASDMTMIRKMGMMLLNLRIQAGDYLSYTHLIDEEIAALLTDARRNVENPLDRNELARLFKYINEVANNTEWERDLLAHRGELELPGVAATDH